MLWRGQELTEDSLVMYDLSMSATNPDISKFVVRAGDIDRGDLAKRTHFEFIRANPDTALYRWPNLFEIMEYQNGQVSRAGEAAGRAAIPGI